VLPPIHPPVPEAEPSCLARLTDRCRRSQNQRRQRFVHAFDGSVIQVDASLAVDGGVAA
jgi:hypothetical protein